MRKDKANQLEADRHYRHCHYQLGKGYWKMLEKEWVEWLERAHSGICISEHEILTTLYSHQQLTVSALAQQSILHISTALNFSGKLMKKGLVQMTKSSEDRRVTYIEITVAGRELVEKIEAQWNPRQSYLVSEVHMIEESSGNMPDFSGVFQVTKNYYGEEMINDLMDKKAWKGA